MLLPNGSELARNLHYCTSHIGGGYFCCDRPEPCSLCDKAVAPMLVCLERLKDLPRGLMRWILCRETPSQILPPLVVNFNYADSPLPLPSTPCPSHGHELRSGQHGRVPCGKCCEKYYNHGKTPAPQEPCMKAITALELRNQAEDSAHKSAPGIAAAVEPCH